MQISVRLKHVRVDEGQLLEKGSPVYVAAERAGRAAVKHVRKELVRKDAIDTRALYESIAYEIHRSGRGIAISVGPLRGSKKVQEYAQYVEYGTRGSIPHAGPKAMPVKIKGGPTIIVSRVKGQEPKRYIRDALRRVQAGDWSDG